MTRIDIRFIGNDGEGFRAVNIEAGIPTSACKAGKHTNAPEFFTWHHMNNFDPITWSVRMQCVDSKFHDLTYQHIGSGIYYKFFGLERGRQNIIEVIN